MFYFQFIILCLKITRKILFHNMGYSPVNFSLQHVLEKVTYLFFNFVSISIT